MIIKKRSLVTCCAPLYLVLLSHATAFPVVASSSALRSCLAPTYYVAASTSSTATPLYPYHRSRLLLRYLRHAAVSPPHHPFTQSARSEPSFPPAPMPCVGVDECPSSGPWSKKPSTAAASGGAVEASMGLASGDGAAKTSTADASAPPCEELPSAAAIFHCRISHRYGVPSSVAFLSAVSPYSADE